MTYKEQLLDPRWQKRRLQILQKDNFQCRQCFDKKSTLHVHHRYYINSRMAWEYDDWELITLCFKCHEIEELIIKQKKLLIINLRIEGYIVPDCCPACGNMDKKIIIPGEILCNLCGYHYCLEEISKPVLVK